MTLAVCFILISEVGWIGGLAGSALIGLITPFVLYLSRYQGLLRRRMLKFTDKRVEIMGEVLSGIRVVKQYNWQVPLSKKVEQIRKDEVWVSLLSHLYNGLSKMVMYLSPSIIMLIVFAVFSSNGGTMDVSLVLTILAFLNSVRFPMNVFPFAAQAIAEAMVSAERVGKYLALEELPHVARFGYENDKYKKMTKEENEMATTASTISNKNGNKKEEKHFSSSTSSLKQQQQLALKITNGVFTWDADDGNPTLKNVNLEIKKGELVAIVGLVGSGKSSLILSLLRETNVLKGTVNVNGTVAYCSQQAWIQNATVRDNILFGLPYVETYYDKILASTMLGPDLKALAGGDQTEIGERGVNLSGGQKARVSLSRALYISNQRDIFLLDDPLSAVDEETAALIFEKAIKSSSINNNTKAILDNKTRVLVMNSHLHLLPEMDKIIVMEEGEIVAFGTLNDVIRKVKWLQKLVNETSGGGGSNHSNEEDHDTTVVVTNEKKDNNLTPSPPIDERNDVNIILTKDDVVEKKQNEAEKPTILVKKEERASGRVDLQVYLFYFTNAWPGHGVLLTVLVIFTFFISEGGRIGSDYALSRFTNDKLPPDQWIGLYGGIVFALATVTLVRTVTFVTSAVFAGRNLHNNLFKSILGAHVTHFFDVSTYIYIYIYYI